MNSINSIGFFNTRLKLVKLVNQLLYLVTNVIAIGELFMICLNETLINQLLSIFWIVIQFAITGMSNTILRLKAGELGLACRPPCKAMCVAYMQVAIAKSTNQYAELIPSGRFME